MFRIPSLTKWRSSRPDVRILYHHRTLADGAEGIHIDAMVSAFRDLGHEVLVRGVAAGSAHGAQRTAAARLRQRLPKPAFEMAALALNGPEYLRVRSEAQRFGADLVYARHARFDIAAIAAARACRIPSILEVNAVFSQGAYHQFEPLSLYRCGRLIETRAISTATVPFAVSTPLAQQMQALSGREVPVIPNGADETRFDPRLADPNTIRRRHNLDGHITVGWSGILRDWHGLELLLEAIAAVPRAHLVIVGDGPARSAVEERARALGVLGRITLTGRVPHGDMPDYIAADRKSVV